MTEFLFGGFDVAINLLESFIILFFVTKCLEKKFEQRKSRRLFVIFWLLLFAELEVLNFVTAFEGILVLITPIIVYIYAELALKAKRLEIIFISLCPTIFTMVINTFVACIQIYICGRNIQDIYLSGSYMYFFWVLLTKVLLVVVLMGVYHLRKRFQKLPDERLWLLFLIILFTSFIIIYLLYPPILFGEIPKQYVGNQIGAVFGVFVMNIVNFYFLRRIGQETELRSEISLLKQSNFYQEENMKVILQKQEQTQKMRHDLKNFLVVVQGLAKNNEDEKIISSCNEYLEEMGNSGQQKYTGIQTVDCLLEYKLNQAEQKHIQSVVQATSLRLREIGEINFCIMLGNLLDNAIEELEKVEENKKLEICLQQVGEEIQLTVKNTLRSPVFMDNPRLETTKEDKEMHGLGVKSVRGIVEQYHGMIEFYEEDGKFVCHVIL